MKPRKNFISGGRILLWLPLACLTGFLVGTWGAQEELRSFKESVKESRKSISGRAVGFDTFAGMVKIPEMARRPRRKKRSGGNAVTAPANAVAAKARKAVAGKDAVPADAGAVSATERNAPSRFTPDDLRVRIEEAQELWRTRVDVVRAQWKEKLNLTGESETAFDAALQEMNERLYDSVAAVAELISGEEEMTPELGLRLVGETTAIMAETYDRIGTCVPQEMRSDVSSMQIVDFVDPSVAEPLIGVQGKLEALGRVGGRRR